MRPIGVHCSCCGERVEPLPSIVPVPREMIISRRIRGLGSTGSDILEL